MTGNDETIMTPYLMTSANCCLLYNILAISEVTLLTVFDDISCKNQNFPVKIICNGYMDLSDR